VCKQRASREEKEEEAQKKRQLSNIAAKSEASVSERESTRWHVVCCPGSTRVILMKDVIWR
jgi:hypothetical protein